MYFWNKVEKKTLTLYFPNSHSSNWISPERFYGFRNPTSGLLPGTKPRSYQLQTCRKPSVLAMQSLTFFQQCQRTRVEQKPICRRLLRHNASFCPYIARTLNLLRRTFFQWESLRLMLEKIQNLLYVCLLGCHRKLKWVTNLKKLCF